MKKFWPVVCIGILWVVFSSPYFFKGLVPFPSSYLVSFFPPWSATYGMPVKNNAMPDVITQIYPWKKLTIESWRAGVIPLWNPYSFSGTAHAANYQTAVFSPFNLLFFILSQVDAWSVLVIIQPILAGLFMYLFLRSLMRSQEASLIGSLAFMFCGFMVVWMAYGTLGFAALWLPLIFYAVHSGWEKPSTWKYALVSIGLALSFVSGHFQISLYVALLSGLFILFKLVTTRKVKVGFIYGLFFLLGICVASPQLMLSFDAYSKSVRMSNFLKGEIIPWQYLVTVFAPDFYGNPVTRNDWFGHYAEWAGYIGVLPLLLAVFSLSRPQKRDEWFYVVAAIMALLFALPTPLADALFMIKIPVLSTSAASRIIILVSFCLAVLSAYGLDHLRDVWKKGTMGPVTRYLVGVLAVLGIIWLVIIMGHPLPADKLAIAKRNLILPSIFLAVSLVLFMAGFVKKRVVAVAIPLIMCLMVAFDVLRFAVKWMPFDPKEFMYPREKSLEFLEQRVGNDRVFGNIGGEAALTFHLPVVEGYDAMYQGRYGEFINAVSKGNVLMGERSVVQFDKHGLYRTKAMQLLGIRYIYHRLSDGRAPWVFPYWEYTGEGSMRQVYNDNVYWIYEYKDAFPRAFLASGYSVVTDKAKIIDTMFSPGFNLRDTLVLEERPLVDPEPGPGEAAIGSYNPNEVIIKTESPVPKLLFLSDVFDPGWKAYIDGKGSPIYRADYDFRALGVPAGNHTIRFTYVPAFLTAALLLSGLSLILIAGLVIKYFYEHRHL